MGQVGHMPKLNLKIMWYPKINLKVLRGHQTKMTKIDPEQYVVTQNQPTSAQGPSNKNEPVKSVQVRRAAK